jgi:DNA-binding response OmpR family regulator
MVGQVRGANNLRDLPKLQHSLTGLELSLARSLDPTRILVADDDPGTSQMLAAVAEKQDYQLVSVSDGREAYRLLKTDSNFKAAIFNMSMPNLKGLDIVRYMKTEKRLMRIPVLVVSAERGLKLMSDSFTAGATMFLSKPFDHQQLYRTLRIVLGSRTYERAA